MAAGIKVEGYRAVQQSLRAADPALKKQFQKEMRTFVQSVVTEARAAASWSNTIPPAITARVGAVAGLRVSAKKAPIAVLNERRSGKWRHPVFGNQKVWVEQKARPSVRPTVEANRTRFQIAALVAANKALHEAGL